MGKDRVEQIWNKGKSEHNRERFGSSEWSSERSEVERVVTGYAKYHYRMLPLTKKEDVMEENVQNCLDKVDITKIWRYASVSLKILGFNKFLQIF